MGDRDRKFGIKQVRKPIALRFGDFKVKWLQDSTAALSAWVLVCYTQIGKNWQLLPGCELVTSLPAAVTASELVTRSLKIAMFLDCVCGQNPAVAISEPWYVGGVRYLTEAEPLPADIEQYATQYVNSLEKKR